VLNSEGLPLAGAPVWLSTAPDALERDHLDPIDHAYTDSSGQFLLTTSRGGAHQVEAIADGYLGGTQRLVVDSTNGVNRVTLSLRRYEAERTRGILLAPDGLPLEESDLALLFPGEFGHDDLFVTTGADGVPELYPFTGRSGLAVSLTPRAGGPRVLPPVARLDPTGAGFSFAAPTGTSGHVSVRFRNQTIATARWTPDVRNVELIVDMAKARSQLSSIEVEIGPGAGTDRALLAALLPEKWGLPLAEWGLLDAPPMLRLVGVPAGRYAFVAVGSNGAAAQTAEVQAGKDRNIVFDPAPLARLSVAFDNRNPSEPVATEQVELRTTEGLRIPLDPDWRVLGNRPTATFSGVPAGALVVHAGGAALSVTARTGATPLEARFPIAPERRYHTRVALNDEIPDGHIVTGRIVRWNSSGILCREQPFHAHVERGSIGIAFDSPPGPHLLLVDLHDGEDHTIKVDLAPNAVVDAMANP